MRVYCSILAPSVPSNSRDINNASPELRSRPICGLPVLGNLKDQGGTWSGGWVYDPRRGRPTTPRSDCRTPTRWLSRASWASGCHGVDQILSLRTIRALAAEGDPCAGPCTPPSAMGPGAGRRWHQILRMILSRLWQIELAGWPGLATMSNGCRLRPLRSMNDDHSKPNLATLYKRSQSNVSARPRSQPHRIASRSAASMLLCARRRGPSSGLHIRHQQRYAR